MIINNRIKMQELVLASILHWIQKESNNRKLESEHNSNVKKCQFSAMAICEQQKYEHGIIYTKESSWITMAKLIRLRGYAHIIGNQS